MDRINDTTPAFKGIITVQARYVFVIRSSDVWYPCPFGEY
jgi:hypothetical protein